MKTLSVSVVHELLRHSGVELRVNYTLIEGVAITLIDALQLLSVLHFVD